VHLTGERHEEDEVETEKTPEQTFTPGQVLSFTLGEGANNEEVKFTEMKEAMEGVRVLIANPEEGVQREYVYR
jgi:hypothetical protein